MRKRILIIVESLDPEHSSGIKGRLSLIENLKKCGFELVIFHYSQKEIELDGVECITIKELKFSFFYILSRTQRIFTRFTNININGLIEKLFGFSFTFFNDVKSIRKPLKNLKIDEFHWVLTLSYAASFRPHRAILGLPDFYNKWLAYVHDPYPMHSYPRPYDWVEPGHNYKRKFFLEISKNAHKVIYPSRLLAEWMSSYYPLQKNKILIIPHQITPLVKSEIKLPRFVDTNKFNILHAGSLMSARRPDGLVEAFKLFLNEIEDAKNHCNLIFIGKLGNYGDYFEKEKSNLKNLITKKYLPFEIVRNIQNTVSLNVIIEAKGPLSPFLPGKFPHLIEAKKQILLLGPIYSESKRVLGKNFENWSEIDDVELIKEKLIKCYLDWQNNMVEINYDSQFFYLSEFYLKDQINSISK